MNSNHKVDCEYPEHYLLDIEEKKPAQQQQNLMPFIPYGVISNLENEVKRVRSSLDIKQEDRQMIQNDSQASLKDDVLCLHNIKGNVKNAYIKKISSLLNVSMEDDKEKLLPSKRVKENISSNSSKQLDNEDLKMLKNRESARNSRQRKKLYIGLLEKKVEDLNGQIEGLRQQTEITFRHIHNIIEQNSCFKGMIIEQAQIFDQLQSKDPETSEGQEMQALLTDSYKLKFSATGSKRKQYIRYCFQNVARILMDGNYGTLLFGSNCLSKNFQLLEDEELHEYIKLFKEITGCSEDKIQHTITHIVRRILEHKRSFSYLIKQMKCKSKDLRICQQQLDDQIDEMTGQMTPQQFTSLLINLNKDDFKIKENLPNTKQDISAQQLQQQQQQQQLMNQYKFLPQISLELLLNNKNTPFLLPNNLMIDPLQFNELIQKQFCKQA
ncbi:unnamed protein product [Paramecium sonneborni]|uniref:BZIP domain-containing protein n=1 Tax=Paramecium sonneborni TaxID=65129 RepID=A0A8S1R0J4_9CILI|nr:unnamed protein product [Paramecium sonneborni]